MVEITGNTYGVRERLKALGCVWRSAAKAWFAPPEIAEQAQALVPKSKGNRPGYAPRTCRQCSERINYGVYCGRCEFGR